MIIKIIGAILFTIAVFAFVNFVGDLAIPKQVPEHETATAAPEPAEVEAASAPEPTPEPEPMPEPEPTPAPQPVAEAAPTPAPIATEPTPAATPTVAPVAGAGALAGDAAKGKKTFRKKCMSCHTMDKGGKDRTGPNLWGVVGRAKGAAENFRYSDTLKMFGGVWTEAEIGSFIAGPRTFIRDTKMTFAGLKNADDRADVIAYLKTLAD